MMNQLKLWMFAAALVCGIHSALAQSRSETEVNEGVRYGCRRGWSVVNTPSRRAQGLNRMVGGDFYLGDRHQLVVLASFADIAFKGDEAETLAQWDKIFNGDNYQEEPFFGSVRDYFRAQSFDQFRLSFDLYHVALAAGHDKYGSIADNDENSQYLVQDIVEMLKDRTDIDWSLYDWNGDGYVNQLLIIFAGKGSFYGGFGGDRNCIWPHQYWLSLHCKDYNQLGSDEWEKTKEYCEAISIGDGDKTYLVDCYCVLQELDRKNEYSIFGTICHEYTHCFGFPDFYTGLTKYVGSWDLMDYGNYNNEGYCPAGYSAHEKMMMGWLTPTELTVSQTVSGMDTSEAYIIHNDANRNEYYMVENRQQTGWDTYLPGSGLVVFHVDFDPDLWVSVIESPNATRAKHYTIFPANNKFANDKTSYTRAKPEDWAYPYLANDSLTNNSSPAATLNNANKDGSYLMNKGLHDMTVEGGLASFRFIVDETATGLSWQEGSGWQLLYRFGPIDIMRSETGEVKKVLKKIENRE